MIEAGAVTLEAAVAGLVAWYDRVDGDNSPYVGPSTRRGLNALKAGEDPRTTGIWGDTNGAPMRIAPIGLLHPGDIEAAVADTVTVCMPTHFTQPAVSGAAAVSAAVAQAMVDGVSLDEVIAAGLRGAELVGRMVGTGSAVRLPSRLSRRSPSPAVVPTARRVCAAYSMKWARP